MISRRPLEGNWLTHTRELRPVATKIQVSQLYLWRYS